jgi:hypothetical protein
MRQERSLEREQSHRQLATSRKTITSQKTDILSRSLASTLSPLKPISSPLGPPVTDSPHTRVSRQASNATSHPNAALSRQPSSALAGVPDGTLEEASADINKQLSNVRSDTSEDSSSAQIRSPTREQASSNQLLTVDTNNVNDSPGGSGPLSADSASQAHRRKQDRKQSRDKRSPSKVCDEDSSLKTAGIGSGSQEVRVSRQERSARIQETSKNSTTAQVDERGTSPSTAAPANYQARLKTRTSSTRNLSTQSAADSSQDKDTARKKKSVFMPPQEDPEMLQDLSPKATSAEVSIRAGLMSAIAETVGMNTTKKVVNKSAVLMTAVAETITISERSCWNSLIINKRFADVLVKLKTILSSVLTCKNTGTMAVEVCTCIYVSGCYLTIMWCTGAANNIRNEPLNSDESTFVQ